MADWATIIAAGVELYGANKEASEKKKASRAEQAALERITRLQAQATLDLDRERFTRERERWQKAMGAYSGFSQAPTLVGRSQMHTPYSTVAGTYFDPSTPNGQPPTGA